jgi:hypothetical protein
LGTLLGFFALFLLALHFLLALLKCNAHKHSHLSKCNCAKKLGSLPTGFTIVVVGVSAASTSTAATVTPVTPTTVRVVGYGFSLIHPEVVAVKRFAMEHYYRLLGVVAIVHLYESKPTRSARLPIHNPVNATEFAERLEQTSQIGFGRFKIQISDKKTFHFISFLQFVPLSLGRMRGIDAAKRISAINSEFLLRANEPRN